MTRDALDPVADYPAELYVAVHTGTPGDVEFYAKACEGASSVLELGCGNARVLCELAELPARVGVGLELHPGLAQLAREQVRTRGLEERVKIDEANMRSFELAQRFERIILPHGSIYCLLDPDDLDRCLEAAARHLTDDGELWLDAYAADGFHATASPEDVADDDLGSVKEIQLGDVRLKVEERSTWDRQQQRIDATYVHTPVTGGASTECVLPQRYLLAEQLLEAILRAGLEPIALFGGFDATPYDPELSDLMIVGAKLAVPLDDPDDGA